ncbi:hypothetical protein [Amycolatopsis cihanbeyliensis]|nr:hypothetical protein [Amycolatopsis cihanbeyliensis]
MSTVLDDSLLDDPDRLAHADVSGLLRGCAMAGAQVRSTLEAGAELELGERLDIGRPRALVVLARDGVSRASAHLLEALLGASCPVPVVVSDVVPGWVGTLDVVTGHLDEGEDPEPAASLERAARYGATIVLSASQDGPVASAVAGRGLLITPRVRVPPELAFPRALAAGLLVANTLGLLVSDLESVADQLDGEAERNHPGHESFVSPAKALALRVAERTPLLWGLDRPARTVGEHGAHVFAAHAATVCDVADHRQAMARPALLRAAITGTSERDIFADPEDEPMSTAPPRVLLLAVNDGPAADATRYRAEQLLPGADVLAPAGEIEAAEPARAAVLALRLEMAAIYLGLATGTIGGAGYAPTRA